MKLNKQEIEDLNDFIFGVPCEWDKRKSCDSMYQGKYNDLVKRIHKAIKFMEEETLKGTIYSVKSIDKLYKMLKGVQNEKQD